MLAKSFLFLALLVSIQCLNVAKSMQRSSLFSSPSLLELLDDCSSGIDLSLECDETRCTVDVGTDGYGGVVTKVSDGVIYVTVTDTDDDDDSCSESIDMVTVVCDPVYINSECVFGSENPDLAITLPDGVLVTLTDVEVEDL